MNSVQEKFRGYFADSCEYLEFRGIKGLGGVLEAMRFRGNPSDAEIRRRLHLVLLFRSFGAFIQKRRLHEYSAWERFAT